MTPATQLEFEATPSRGDVCAVLTRPRGAKAMLVLAHGAGAGMHHPFMATMAQTLADRKLATFRFQFPYTQAGKKRPDPGPVLMATVASAIATAAKKARGLPVFAGGKSMGGRMTSLRFAKEPIDVVRGIFFLGFPLHAPGKQTDERADHLAQVDLPLLFVQGTRDKLADLSRLTPIVTNLGRRATLHVIDDGDHSLAVPKRAGRTHQEILTEVADTMASWVLAHS